MQSYSVQKGIQSMGLLAATILDKDRAYPADQVDTTRFRLAEALATIWAEFLYVFL